MAQLSIFACLCIAAYAAEWSYDESWTYQSIQGLGVREIISYSGFKIANNHVLNSLYFYVLSHLHIRNVFFYRIPALLCYWGYVFFINKVLSLYPNTKFSPLEKYALYITPWLVYFMQGRGYAMAITGFVASFYYYRQFLISAKSKALAGFIIAGGISAISIFSFCMPFIAMLWLLAATRYAAFVNQKKNIAIALLSIPVLLYVYFKGSIINLEDPHIVGGNYFIKNGTLSSIITFMCLYDFIPYTLFMVFKLAFLLSLFSATVYLIRTKKWQTEYAIIGLSLLLMVILHYTTGAKYPMYRSVLYIPLLLSLAFIIIPKKSIVLSAYLYVVFVMGFVGLVVFMRTSMAPDTYNALQYVSHHGNNLLVSDNFIWVNQNNV